MKELLQQLAARMRREMDDLERIIQRALLGFARAKKFHDDMYLDSVALNLHGFYSGLERLFEVVAARVDCDLPQGANWHQALLCQMANELPGVRPAVISIEMLDQLDAYRGFRHVVRNVYTYKFDAVKIEILTLNASTVFNQLKMEVLAFADFLDSRAEDQN